MKQEKQNQLDVMCYVICVLATPGYIIHVRLTTK